MRKNDPEHILIGQKGIICFTLDKYQKTITNVIVTQPFIQSNAFSSDFFLFI